MQEEDTLPPALVMLLFEKLFQLVGVILPIREFYHLTDGVLLLVRLGQAVLHIVASAHRGSQDSSRRAMPCSWGSIPGILSVSWLQSF